MCSGQRNPENPENVLKYRKVQCCYLFFPDSPDFQIDFVWWKPGPEPWAGLPTPQISLLKSQKILKNLKTKHIVFYKTSLHVSWFSKKFPGQKNQENLKNAIKCCKIQWFYIFSRFSRFSGFPLGKSVGWAAQPRALGQAFTKQNLVGNPENPENPEKKHLKPPCFTTLYCIFFWFSWFLWPGQSGKSGKMQ